MESAHHASWSVWGQLLDPGLSLSLVPFAKMVSQAGLCWPGFNAVLEKARFASLPFTPPILTTDDRGQLHSVDRAVGPAHRMMSGDLITLGPNKVFSTDLEVAIPQQHIESALRAARQVFDAHHISLPGVGAFLRFTKIERAGWLTYHGAATSARVVTGVRTRRACSAYKRRTERLLERSKR